MGSIIKRLTSFQGENPPRLCLDGIKKAVSTSNNGKQNVDENDRKQQQHSKLGILTCIQITMCLMYELISGLVTVIRIYTVLCYKI